MKHSKPSSIDFELVWEQYHPRLAVFVSNMVQRENLDWEDLVQDIMLKVYKNIHRYDPAYSFTTWFYSIARNHCIDALNKAKTNARTINALKVESKVSGPSDDDPERAFFKQTLGRRVQTFIDDLDPLNRKIVFLRFYEALKYREIAAIVGLPDGTVKYRVHLVRQELKQELKGVLGVAQ